MAVSVAALATVLTLGVTTLTPVAAFASTGPGADTPQQYWGPGYPYGNDWTNTWSGYGYPYYGSTYWNGWSSAGYPYSMSNWGTAYNYSPWSIYNVPYAGSPGYPYYRYGADYGYGYGVPPYVNQNFSYGSGTYYGPTYCGFGYTC
jgi:hypothetical protein